MGRGRKDPRRSTITTLRKILGASWKKGTVDHPQFQRTSKRSYLWRFDHQGSIYKISHGQRKLFGLLPEWLDYLELIDLSTIREQFNSKIKVFYDHGCSIPSLPDFSHLGLLSTSVDTSSFLGRITKVVLDRQEARPNLYGTQCFKYLSLGGDWWFQTKPTDWNLATKQVPSSSSPPPQCCPPMRELQQKTRRNIFEALLHFCIGAATAIAGIC